MSCERCGGFMVTEVACGCPGEPALYGSFGNRCLNCGHLEDSVMRLNRIGQASARKPAINLKSNRLFGVTR